MWGWSRAIKTRPATSTAERTELTADSLLGVAMMLCQITSPFPSGMPGEHQEVVCIDESPTVVIVSLVFTLLKH